MTAPTIQGFQQLPAPEFAHGGGEFHVTFRKDSYTDERLKSLGLSDRQIKGVRYPHANGEIKTLLVGRRNDDEVYKELKRKGY